MASEVSFVEFVRAQGSGIESVTARKMFGEWALYVGAKVVALVCDDRVFLKITDEGRRRLDERGGCDLGPAYPGAKDSFLVDAFVDSAEFFSELIAITAEALPEPAPKEPRKTSPAS